MGLGKLAESMDQDSQSRSIALGRVDFRAAPVRRRSTIFLGPRPAPIVDRSIRRRALLGCRWRLSPGGRHFPILGRGVFVVGGFDRAALDDSRRRC